MQVAHNNRQYGRAWFVARHTGGLYHSEAEEPQTKSLMRGNQFMVYPARAIYAGCQAIVPRLGS